MPVRLSKKFRKKWSEKMKRIVVYPGSFDPPTYGHLDIIQRVLTLFDKVIVAVMDNPNKCSLFSIDERIKIFKEITRRFKKVEVDKFKGLLVNYVKKKKAQAVVRGLRAISDFEYEFQMAQMNRELSTEVETIFMMTSTPYSYLSSSIVKEIAKLGGDIGKFVPRPVEWMLKKKMKEGK